MSCSDYIRMRWLLQQHWNSKQGNFATEAKEARKARQVALQKEDTKNDGFLALVMYPLIRS